MSTNLVSRLRTPLSSCTIEQLFLERQEAADCIEWLESEIDRVSREWAETSQTNFKRAKAAEAALEHVSDLDVILNAIHDVHDIDVTLRDYATAVHSALVQCIQEGVKND
jgi:hypothetical protein